MWSQITRAYQYILEHPLDCLLMIAILHYVLRRLSEKKEKRRKKSKTLFTKIGGEETLRQCVEIFYVKVLNSKLISHFFVDLDLARQKKMMFNFLAYSFHSPYHVYDGKNMSDAHKNLVLSKGLNDKHFDEMINLMKESLLQLGIPNSLIQQAIEEVENVRPQILSREGCYDSHY